MKEIYVFSDESYYTNFDLSDDSGDYSAISMIAIAQKDYGKFEELSSFQNNREFSWKELKYPATAKRIKTLLKEIKPLVDEGTLKIHSVVYR